MGSKSRIFRLLGVKLGVKADLSGGKNARKPLQIRDFIDFVKTGLHFDNGHFYPKMNTHTYAHLEGCRMYEKLYADNIKLLWYWANRYANACRLQAGVDLEDLVQSGFLAVVEAYKSFDKEQAAWGTWASWYIQNSIKESLGLRGKKRINAVSLNEPVTDSDGNDTDRLELIEDTSLAPADESIITEDISAAVHNAVDAIQNATTREAIRFVYLEGNSHAQAARRLGIKPETVGGHLNRGRQAMRRNGRLKREIGLDEETRFHAHKGVSAFISTGSSVVEDAVLWREEQRRKAEKRHFENHDKS